MGGEGLSYSLHEHLRPSSFFMGAQPRQDTIVYLPPFPRILPSLEMLMLETFF